MDLGVDPWIQSGPLDLEWTPGSAVERRAAEGLALKRAEHVRSGAGCRFPARHADGSCSIYGHVVQSH